jgi:hypothetical protein
VRKLAVTPELAAKLEASRCKLTPGEPLHMTKALMVQLLDQRDRVADTLEWLRSFMGKDPDCQVPARDVWNRLCLQYFDPRVKDPDEISPAPSGEALAGALSEQAATDWPAVAKAAEPAPGCYCEDREGRPHPAHRRAEPREA